MDQLFVFSTYTTYYLLFIFRSHEHYHEGGLNRRIMKKIIIAGASVLCSIAAVISLSVPTSAYILSCPDEGRDSEGYYYKRCLTSVPGERFQVYALCVNFLDIGDFVYGNIAQSGGKSRVKCGFGTSPRNGTIYVHTV